MALRLFFLLAGSLSLSAAAEAAEIVTIAGSGKADFSVMEAPQSRGDAIRRSAWKSGPMGRSTGVSWKTASSAGSI
ncbi:MAG: hypothetical protein U0872_03165 [Planctomycetaceae bacterium]